MKKQWRTLLALIGLVVVLSLLTIGEVKPAAAQRPQPTPNPKLPEFFNPPTATGPTRTVRLPNGESAVVESNLASAARPRSAQSTGGPDQFGYTWNDSLSLSWIDALAGTNTGMNGSNQAVGPIALPFSFKYYENTYNQFYINTSGILGFNSLYGARGQQMTFPNPAPPTNVIAPHWAPLNASTGGVYYLSGGIAPNRWLAVEWFQVRDYDPSSRLTFEAILYENGDILFQYLSQNYGLTVWGRSIGIEDSLGTDGLKYPNFPSSGKVIRFYRPAPAARISITPVNQGRFTYAGGVESFQFVVRNTGEIGTDTFDLIATSPWSLALYASNGKTLLSDTNGNGIPDTGPLLMGASFTVIAKITVPGGAVLGDNNNAVITVRSSLDTTKQKTAYLQLAIPSPFAQAYTDSANGALSLYRALPTGQNAQKVTPDWTNGYNPSIAETPGGNFIYAWYKYRCVGNPCVSKDEIYYTLLNNFGVTIRPVTQLTDNSGIAGPAYDFDPTVAIAPNGNIGILWSRELDDSTYTNYNSNIYFAVLDASGNPIYGPTNITNNSAWGPWGALYIPYFYFPRIVATDDNHFVLSWLNEQYGPPTGSCTSYCRIDDIYYAVRDSTGNPIGGTVKLTNDTVGYDDGYYSPNLARLSGNRVLLPFYRYGYGSTCFEDILYAVLDSNGNLVKGVTALTNDSCTHYNYGPDAVQMSDGKILVAWTRSDSSRHIGFAVLDAAYNLAAGPADLYNPVNPAGNDYVSVTADASAHGILTWKDAGSRTGLNLYYALVDGSGAILTQPRIFQTGQTTGSTVLTSREGYGNTSYSWVAPAGVDLLTWCGSSSYLGLPGGNAAITLNYSNHGATLATSIALAATLGSGLTYAGDTSGIAPTVSGPVVTWNLPNMPTLGFKTFKLYAQVPAGDPVGALHDVALNLTSAQPDVNPANNTATCQVQAAQGLFLPLITK